MKTSRPTKKAPPSKPSAHRAKGAKPRTRAPGEASVERRTAPRRADFGAPVDAFFAKQPPQLKPILDALRALVEETAPDATASIKWGMPFYVIGGETVCALAGFKAHVNLILPGAPGTFADPDGRLEGEGKTGQHLKLRALVELPRAAVRGWLRTTAQAARKRSAGQ